MYSVRNTLSLLFFYSPSTPRDRRSFPTRRSSDLYTTAIMIDRWGVPYGWTIPVAGLVCLLAGYRDRPAVGDRKSTRLNSSHQIISYAVFCLKKKTTAARHHTPPNRTPWSPVC